MSSTLPEQFRELEPFAKKWALATQLEREAQRRSSATQDRRKFYDAMTSRLEAIVGHLNQLPLDGMPAPERRLLHMLLSLAEVAPTIELYKGSATVPYSFEETRFMPAHGDRED